MAVITGTANDDTLNGVSGESDTIDGLAGDDTINGADQDDTLIGGEGNDTVDGGDQNDLIGGGTGNDDLMGGSGDDVVYGDEGNDTISGGTGDDYIDGGSGDDTISVGNGQSLFDGGTDYVRWGPGSGNDEVFGLTRAEGDRIFLDGIAFNDLTITPTNLGNGTYDYTVTSTTDPSIQLIIRQVPTFLVNPTDPSQIAGMFTETLPIPAPPVSPSAPCFVRRTLIKTPLGEVSVEDLRAGDLVSTQNNDAQIIRWIGSRKLSSIDLVNAPELRPIKIKRHARGKNQPSNDLWLSPEHRIVCDDNAMQLLFGEDQLLVAAKDVVNGKTIFVDQTDSDVEYFHILFDKHEVIFSNSLPSESFHPAIRSESFIDAGIRNEIHALFPDLSSDFSDYGPTHHQTLKSTETRLLQSLN